MGVDIRNYAKIWPFYHFCLVFQLLIFITTVIVLLSTIILPFAEILRLIFLDMNIILLSASVIILFVYDSDLYGTAATPGKELFMITIYGFQSLLFVIGGFVWDNLAVSDPPLLLYFLV